MRRPEFRMERDAAMEQLVGKSDIGQHLRSEKLTSILEALWLRGDRDDHKAIQRILAAHPETPTLSFLQAPEGTTLLCDIEQEADIQAAAELLEDAYWNEDFDIEEIAASLRHSSALVGAKDSQTGTLIGVMRGVSDQSKHAWIYDVMVAPSWRGRGLGKAMMTLLLAHPRMRDAKKLHLQTKDAQGLYEPFGFRDIATLPPRPYKSIRMFCERSSWQRSQGNQSTTPPKRAGFPAMVPACYLERIDTMNQMKPKNLRNQSNQIDERPHEINGAGQAIGISVPDWRPCVRPPQTPMNGIYCRLEPIDIAAHAAGLYRAYGQEQGQHHWTYLSYGPFATFEAFVEWMQSTCLGEDALFFAICDAVTGAAVGLASYLRIAPAIGSVEVGHVHFSPGLQRTPMATEAMFLMMHRVFAELGYRRYEWKCDALNQRSWDAALRLGFSLEGVFRQATVYKGRNRDTAWFSILDSEWPLLERAFRAWLDPDNFDADGCQRASLATLRGLL